MDPPDNSEHLFPGGVHDSGWNTGNPNLPPDQTKANSSPRSSTMDLDEDRRGSRQGPSAQPQPPLAALNEGGDPLATPSSLVRILAREVRLVQESVRDQSKALQEAVVTTVEEALSQIRREMDDNSGNDGEEQSSSESGDPCTPRKGGKNKAKNDYHSVLRDWLCDKGLRKDTPSMIPDGGQIQEYVDHRRNGPNAEEPLFDWTVPFGHIWNDELLGMLAEAFILHVTTEGQIRPDQLEKKYFELREVKKIISVKLRDVKNAFLRRYDHETGVLMPTSAREDRAQVKKAAKTVRKRHHSRTIGTFSRRKKIIKHYKGTGTELPFWQGMADVLTSLGRGGMSSDESGYEAPRPGAAHSRTRKRVRQRPKTWLNHEIGELWQHVEQCYDGLPDVLKRGNTPYDRIPEPKRAPPQERDKAKVQYVGVVKNLPTNWYDHMYWIGLTPQAQKSVSQVPARPLPQIPVSFLCLFCCNVGH
ncbi:hypothetical protein FA13DRAFT_1784914 [Coprinellus micaceus]|uniref:Uncharacterized protein n=1 Tax=Coprinellus micaceus TaxID=71717 RepID=A0A4Y7TWP7_COPMI|nr:hypothetical protein FA13DRAFT_1784914 [Coprinellus micaceus]